MRTYHVTSSLIPVLVLVATTAVSAQELTKEEVPGIRNYTRVDATIACAGATSLDALAEIQRRGFAAIVNFRTEGENGAHPAAAAERAEELGLKYFHIPFRGSAPTVQAADASYVTGEAGRILHGYYLGNHSKELGDIRGPDECIPDEQSGQSLFPENRYG